MKIVRNLPVPSTGPSTELVAIQCDFCGRRYGAVSRDHTPRIDLDDGDAIIRGDLCIDCLASVLQALGDRTDRMRPITARQANGWRSHAYTMLDAEDDSEIHCTGIGDEHSGWRIS